MEESDKFITYECIQQIFENSKFHFATVKPINKKQND